MIKVYPLRVRKGSFINYTYLVVNQWTNESIIIDPAWELDTITTYLLKTNSHLKGILLTHHHRDHTLLAPVLASRFGVPVFMGMIEKEFYNFNCLNLEVVSSDLLFSIGGFGIFPHHTPGHTKGSLCFQIDNYLFTGDTLFIEGCGLCLNETGAKEMFKSLQKLKANIGSSVIIYPGHSYGIQPGINFKHVLAQNIYCHLNEEDRFVAFRLRKNQKGLFNFK